MYEFPWSVLEIAPTSDQRAIKKAYAKKLKRCRPDDNPDGFQELHKAYTDAQYLAKELAEEQALADVSIETASTSSEAQSSQIDIGDDGSMSLSASTASVDTPSDTTEAAVVEKLAPEDIAAVRIAVDEGTEIDRSDAVVDDIIAQQKAYDEEQAAFKAYTEELVELLKSTSTDPDYDLWDRYLNSPFMQDFDYRRHTGYWLFDTLINLCVHYYEREDGDHRVRFDPKVSPKLLAGLDNFFKWTEHRIELENNFDLNGVDYLLYLVEEYSQSNSSASASSPSSGQQYQAPLPPERQDLDLSFADESRMFLARSIACVIDSIIIFSSMAILTDLPWIKAHISEVKHHDMLISLVIASVYIPIMESLNGATVGQQYQGLQVLHAKTGKKLSFLHSLVRLYVFLISSFAFKITLWANLFFCRHPYVHDLASRSRVEPADD